ncbi:MAG: hypothetical protein BMS9Abin29_0081 [Gemmatimonadota bacterium]|nr:MAG: hypothetical protein BMS9Abin29_0081 [Gemmatimonadota bacterium]
MPLTPPGQTKRLRNPPAPFLLLGAALVSGCGAGAVGPSHDFDDVEYGNLTYQVKSVRVAESFPVQVGVTVGVRNRTTSTQSVTFPDGCVVLMRAYGGDPPPVWDMATGLACTLALVQRDLAPGEEIEFDAGLVSARTILGEALPSGEYRLTAYLRPGGAVLELEMGRYDLARP